MGVCLVGLLLACGGDRGIMSADYRQAVVLPEPDPAGMGEASRARLRDTHDQARKMLAARDADAAQIGEALGRLGMLFHAEGLRLEAVTCYRLALQYEPNRFRWRYFLARVYQRLSEFEQAHDAFLQALETAPDHIPSLIAVGEYLRGQNRLDEAEARFRHALAKKRDCAAAMVGLAQVAMARKDYQTARTALAAAETLQPASSGILYLHALVHRSLGEVDTARELMARHSAATTDTRIQDPLLDEIGALQWQAYDLLQAADRALETGDLPNALKNYHQSIQLDPNQHESRVKFASALERARRPREALTQYRESLRIKAGVPIVHFNIGTLQVGLGEHDQAIQSFRQALALDPSFTGASMRLADTQRAAGRFEEALAVYRQIVADKPALRPAYMGNVLCLVRLGRYRQAQATLLTGLERFPEERAFTHTLARLMAAAPVDDLRDGAKAATLMTSFLKGPANREIAETVAMAMAESGRFDLAVRYQNTAIDIARQTGDTGLLPFLQANLAAYQAGRPCRQPWDEQDGSIFSCKFTII